MITDKNKTARIVLSATFTVLICVSAFFKIPLPYGNAFTLQTFFVILAGFVLGAYYGGFSAFAYVLIGLVGVPVFTQGGGISYVFSPTFGYLVGFIISATLAGFLSKKFIEKFKGKNFLAYLSSAVIALLPTHILGIIYLYIITKFYTGNTATYNSEIVFGTILISNITTTIPIDICKAILVAIIAARLYKVLVDKKKNLEN